MPRVIAKRFPTHTISRLETATEQIFCVNEERDDCHTE